MAKKPKPTRPPQPPPVPPPVPPPPPTPPPAPASVNVVFVWGPVVWATRYVLQIGTGLAQSDVFNSDLGLASATTVKLTPGTYYSRVLAYQNDTFLSVTAAQRTVVL